MAKKKKNNLTLGPVLTIVAIIFIIIIVSFVFSKLGFVTTKTELINGEILTTNISVNNLLSNDGLKFIFSSVIDNFKNYSVIYVLIISLLGIGIAEDSGLFRRIFKGGRKLKLSFVILITMIIGCIAGGLGLYNYAILLPLSGYVYKNLNKNPLVGILTMFFSLTIGQATGILPTYLEQSLGVLTQTSAINSVDKNFVYTSSSTIYIVISSLILFIIYSNFYILKYFIHI